MLVSIGGQAANLVFTRSASAATAANGSLRGPSLLGALDRLDETTDALGDFDPAHRAAPPSSPDAPVTSLDVGGGGAPTSACGPGMVLVEGNYCPDVAHTCKRFMETTGRYANYRCEEYTDAKCQSKTRVAMKFCMDRDEFVPQGENLPSSHVSWTDADQTCKSLGKRVCLESEYNFACEGEEMRPYPYGWKRDATACNADRVDIYKKNGQLKDLRAGADEFPRCVSPFGVHNLAGNLEEWTTIDVSAGSAAPRPAMKGAYWQPSRNHCRANQTAHDRFYKGTETGFRCCGEAKLAGAGGSTSALEGDLTPALPPHLSPDLRLAKRQ